MKRLSTVIPSVTLLLFGAGLAMPVLADGTVDEHRPLNATGHVYLNNVAGSVSVSTWDKNEIYLRGELSGDADSVDISGDPASLGIVVKMPKHSHSSGDAALQLTVPVGASVELQTVSADVTAQDLHGVVKVGTVSGEVQMQLASPEVSVQTVSGDVKLRAPSKVTSVKSVSGDLHVSGVQGRLVVETVSGNVQLDGGRFSDVKLKSVSGDMRLDVTLEQAAQVIGDTLSGEITLAVPSDVSGTALLKSFSGEASCDGSSTASASSSSSSSSSSSASYSGRGPSTGGKHEYVWGDGQGARVELSSFSGDIHVERKLAHGTQTPPPFVGKD